jgi:hypothetical protein
MSQKLTFNEVVEHLNNTTTISDFAYIARYGKTIIEGLGEVKEVDSYGGEDKGSDWYTVKHFIDHDVYIRIDAYYSSYDGTDFDNSEYEEVFPTEVKRIEYLPLKK